MDNQETLEMEKVTEAVKETAETTEAVEETAEATTEAVEETAEETTEAVEETAEETTEAVEESMQVATEAVEETAEGATEAVEETAEETTEAVEESTQAVTEAVEETAEGTTEAVEESMQVATEAVEETAEETTEAVEESMQVATEAVEESTQAVTEAVEETAEETTEAVEETAEGATEAQSGHRVPVRRGGPRSEYQMKLQEARQQCLEELCLDLSYLEEQYHEVIYMYDSSRGRAGNSFGLTVDQIYRIKNPLTQSAVRQMKKDRERDQRRLNDEIEVDGVKFSRARFYANRYFVKDLRRYYNNLDFRCSLVQRGSTWKLFISW